MAARETWQIAKDTVNEFMQDKALQLGAALSFYALLSLAPLLVVFVGVAGMVFGRDAASGQLVGELQRLIGPQGAQVAQTVLQHAATPKGNILAVVIGIAVLLFGATGVFVQLQSSLNQIWEVQVRPGQGVRGVIRERLMSLLMVVLIGFLLLATVIVSAVLTTIATYMTHLVPSFSGTWHVVDIAISLIITTLLFAIIFKVLPDVEISWGDVWIGAIVTAILFTIGKILIGLYLGHSSVGSVYGAAGSVVVLMVWIYYSSLILFLGAEFTQVYGRHYGARITPSKHAEATQSEKLAPGMG